MKQHYILYSISDVSGELELYFEKFGDAVLRGQQEYNKFKNDPGFKCEITQMNPKTVATWKGKEK